MIEYPFDTVKVRLQSQASGPKLRYTGPLDCFRQSVTADGIYGGLFRGVSTPIVGAAIETSSLFFSVGPYNIHGNDNRKLSSVVWSGSECFESYNI